VPVVPAGRRTVPWPEAGMGGAVRTGRGEPIAVLPTSVPPGTAADLLARLRLADARLLLASRDIARLAPAVDDWLARAATPAQITRTLTTGLPPVPEPIHHPARFLEHRLTALLPPPLPPESARPAPLRTCDGCDRAFRTHDPAARCADCRAGSPLPGLPPTGSDMPPSCAPPACPQSADDEDVESFQP
jgi:hypothetical protein